MADKAVEIPDKKKENVTKKDRDNLISMSDEDVIALVDEDFTTSKKVRDQVNPKNQRMRKHYFNDEILPAIVSGKEVKVKPDSRSHIRVPMIPTLVDTAMAIIAGSIFSLERFVKTDPNNADDFDAASAFEDWFYFAIGRSQMDFRKHFKDEWLFQAHIYDYSIARFGWLVEKGYVPGKEQRTETVLLNNTAKIPREIYNVKMILKRNAVDRPEIEVLDTLLTYPDAHSTDFSGSQPSRYFIYLQETNISSLKRRDIYKNVDKIEEDSHPGFEESQKTKDKQKLDNSFEVEKDSVRIKWYFTPDTKVGIANDKWVVFKPERTYGYPFSKMTYCQPNHQWSGIGMVEMVEMLQNDLNKLFRARRNNIDFIVDALGVINTTLLGGIGKQDLRRGSGKMIEIRAGDPSKVIYYDRPPDVTQTITQDMTFEVNMMERRLSLAAPSQGVNRQGGRITATEIDAVSQGTASRMGEIIRDMEDKNIVDMVNHLYTLAQLYLTDEAKFKILGVEGYKFRTVSRKDMWCNSPLDVHAVGSRYEANRTIADNKFLQSTNILINNEMMGQILNFKEIAKEVLRRGGERSPERFLVGDDEGHRIPQEFENILMANGHDLPVGVNDNDQEHIATIEAFQLGVDWLEVPEVNKFFIEKHKQLHVLRMQQVQQGGSAPQMGGGAPEPPEEQLGQELGNLQQQAGGMRTPMTAPPEPQPSMLEMGGGM